MIFKQKIKKFIIKHKKLLYLIRLVYSIFRKSENFSSSSYWEKRYVEGRNSGAGSYGRLAKFKAEIINKFIKTNKINSIIEFGCGDGNQLSLFNTPKYIGLDISKKSIELCKKRFLHDRTKSFFIYNTPLSSKAELTLSLDVIYHLVEDKVFSEYINTLFSASKKYVIIYSSNINNTKELHAKHVLHRNFSKYVDNNLTKWKLIKKIKNKYPLKNNPINESLADFYIYKKQIKL